MVTWMAVSMMIIRHPQYQGFVLSFVSAIMHTVTSLEDISFIDNTNIHCIAQRESESIESVNAWLQEFISCWEGYLAATGGV